MKAIKPSLPNPLKNKGRDNKGIDMDI